MRRLQSMAGVLVVLWGAGCDFETEPVTTGEQPSTSGAGTGAAEGPDASVDAGATRVGLGEDAGRNAGVLDATTPDGAQPGRDAAAAAGDAATGSQDAGVDAGSVADAGDAGGEPADAGPPPDPPDTFGLVCASVTCPGVPSTSEQCCTAQVDVDAKNARQPDRCGVVREAAGGCLELEQPGVPDDACPTTVPPGASAAEPGCCTVEGQCGTLDAVEGAGCHIDGKLNAQSCGDIEVGEVCEPTGVFAMLAEVDVAWGGQSGGFYDVTDDGRGLVKVWLRLAIDAVGADGSFDGVIQPCGASLPPFKSSLLCESYQPTFPDAVWDDERIAAVPVQGRYQCDNPGCIVELDAATGLVGIALDDIDGAWPAADAALDISCPAGDGTDCYADHDDDGKPGVTVLLPSTGSEPASSDCSSGYPNRGAPLSANLFAIIDGVRRTDRVQLGVRLRLGGAGRLGADCDSAMGGGVADFVQSRAAGCMAEQGTRYFPFGLPAGANTSCNSGEADFVNENLPIYDILALGEEPRASLSLADDSPSEGMQFALQRLAAAGESVSCADVRAAIQ